MHDHQQHPSPPHLSGLKVVCQEETDCTKDAPEKVPARAPRRGPHTRGRSPPPPQNGHCPAQASSCARRRAAEWRPGCAETVQRVSSQQPKAADPEALPRARVHGLSIPRGPPQDHTHTCKHFLGRRGCQLGCHLRRASKQLHVGCGWLCFGGQDRPSHPCYTDGSCPGERDPRSLACADSPPPPQATGLPGCSCTPHLPHPDGETRISLSSRHHLLRDPLANS